MTVAMTNLLPMQGSDLPVAMLDWAGPAVTLPAWAKINLTLHVTGQRADGYHLLDSMVVFAAVGDVLHLSPGPLDLRMTGPFAAGLTAELQAGGDNLCLKAARMAGRNLSIVLDKRLPLASGIGGGSADAAAVLRGLAADVPDPKLLGADVPVCLASRPTRMRGIGELLDPLPPLPDLHLVLVNPCKAVPTPAVFAALQCRDNPAMPDPTAWTDRAAFLQFLRECRNDLEAPAICLLPAIAEGLSALRGAGAELARMSGSGATCFGIFPDREAAERAAMALSRPDWWVVATGLAPLPDLG